MYVVHTTADNCEAILFPRLFSFIDDIGLWMPSNRLKLNAEKMQFTCLGTRYQLAKIDSSDLLVNGSAVDLLRAVTCLGVTIHQKLTFTDHNHTAHWSLFSLSEAAAFHQTITDD